MEPIQIPETPSHQKRPPSARGPGKKRWGLAIGLASAALIVGLMIVVGLQNDDADGPTEALPQSPTQSVTRARPERKAELSATISVGIISEPNGATVSDGEEILGQAPMTVHLKRSKPARKLTFKLEGHRSRTLVIRGRDSPMRVIKLRK